MELPNTHESIGNEFASELRMIFIFGFAKKDYVDVKLGPWETLLSKIFGTENFRFFLLGKFLEHFHWKSYGNWNFLIEKNLKIFRFFRFFSINIFRFSYDFQWKFSKKIRAKKIEFFWSQKNLVGKFSKCSNFKAFAIFFFGSKAFVQKLFEVCWHKKSRSESR